MANLFLVRHGQSKWNAKNKFTGWVDVELSILGKKEAKKAGKLIRDLNVPLDYAFTSFLKRAKITMEIILNEINQKNLKIKEAWQLNERHYGSLTGLNKKETELQIGKELFRLYRRSWNKAPPKINLNNPNINLFSNLNEKIQISKIPTTESLKNTYERVIPYYEENILPIIKKGKSVLIVAHGNSLRALCKNIFKINNTKINNLEIPTGNPMHIKFCKKINAKEAYYLDSKRKRDIHIK